MRGSARSTRPVWRGWPQGRPLRPAGAKRLRNWRTGTRYGNWKPTISPRRSRIISWPIPLRRSSCGAAWCIRRSCSAWSEKKCSACWTGMWPMRWSRKESTNISYRPLWGRIRASRALSSWDWTRWADGSTMQESAGSAIICGRYILQKMQKTGPEM